MSNRDLKLLLEDMLESALKIKRYTSNLDFDTFVNDDKTVDAVVRNFEIIGEAANRIGPDFKIMNSDIEWNRIRGFRNRIVHEIVWTIIENDLDKLIVEIKYLISNSNNDQYYT